MISDMNHLSTVMLHTEYQGNSHKCHKCKGELGGDN